MTTLLLSLIIYHAITMRPWRSAPRRRPRAAGSW